MLGLYRCRRKATLANPSKASPASARPDGSGTTGVKVLPVVVKNVPVKDPSALMMPGWFATGKLKLGLLIGSGPRSAVEPSPIFRDVTNVKSNGTFAKTLAI